MERGLSLVYSLRRGAVQTMWMTATDVRDGYQYVMFHYMVLMYLI